MENNNNIELLKQILKKYPINDLKDKLNISKGTINRWIKLNKVPKQYTFELYRLLNIEIDYTKYSIKEKDQYYTPIKTVMYCYNTLKNILLKYNNNINKYIFIEPSAGDGSFLKILPKHKRIGLDIEPKHEEIIKGNYLTWEPENKDIKYIVIGNPPFGLRGHLALKFINHSYKFADYVCFILPQLFESDGKGVPRKRVKNYNLIHSKKIDSHFYQPDKKELKINCIFQIWSKNDTNDKYKLKKYNNDILKIYSLSDGGTPSTIRNKKMFNKCDIYIPSTCFGKSNMKYYKSFNTLPNKRGYGIVFNKDKNININKFKNIKWEDISFLSTNSAYNLRSSKIYEIFNN